MMMIMMMMITTCNRSQLGRIASQVLSMFVRKEGEHRRRIEEERRRAVEAARSATYYLHSRRRVIAASFLTAGPTNARTSCGSSPKPEPLSASRLQ